MLCVALKERCGSFEYPVNFTFSEKGDEISLEDVLPAGGIGETLSQVKQFYLENF